MSWRSKSAIVAAAELAGGTQVWAQSSKYASTGWNWPPYIILPLIAAALLYAVGISRMRHRNSRIPLFPVLCFAAGWLSLLLALDSPIHELSEQLFWVHMVQHEILMLISAPLLVLSQPSAPLLWALPERWRIFVANIGKLRT